MKSISLLCALALAGALSGCGSMQMDTSGGADPNRVVNGTVELGGDTVFPPDAVVAVRVVDQVHAGYKNPNAALGEPTATAAISLPPEVLGEQKIAHPTGSSAPFSLKFYCTDEQLSSGLVLQARVSFGGKVRYFNVESYALNTANIDYPRHIYVNQVR